MGLAEAQKKGIMEIAGAGQPITGLDVENDPGNQVITMKKDSMLAAQAEDGDGKNLNDALSHQELMEGQETGARVVLGPGENSRYAIELSETSDTLTDTFAPLLPKIV